VGGVPAQRVVQEIVFDELGEHVARRSVPVGELTPPDKMTYDHFEYDVPGRVVKHTAPWGAVTTYEYNGAGVMVTGPGPIVTKTFVHHDGLGRPVLVQDKAGSTSYVYGPFGGLYSVTDPGGDVTTTERDAYGRVWKSVDPDRKTTIAHYNGFGELTSSTDAQNRTITYEHDALGRLIQRTDNDGETVWSWDKAVHGVGRIAEVKGPGGPTVTTTYDELSRPLLHRLSLDGEHFDMGAAPLQR
jgi:YD repeat-containing protein